MISLSMIAREDAEILALTLPAYAHAFTERRAVVFPGKDETAKVLESHGFQVHLCDWPGSYSIARNYLLDWLREDSKLPWTAQIDADEAIFPFEVGQLEKEARSTRWDLIGFPRHNFVGRRGDPVRHNPHSYPDWQVRVVRLSSPVRFKLAVHEVPYNPETGEVLSGAGKFERSSVHLFHYHPFKSLQSRWLKEARYQAMLGGTEPPSSCPVSESDLHAQWDFAEFPIFPTLHPLQHA